MKARHLQDEAIEEFPSLWRKLGLDAQIVFSLVFKAALYRIQAGQVSRMSNGLPQSIHSFLCNDTNDNWAQSERRPLIVERTVKRQKVSNSEQSAA